MPLTSSVELETNWRKEVVLHGLNHPWGIAWLPDGAVLISERAGRLRIARDGVLAQKAVTGTPEVLVEGQGGLLDISLHPDFEQNHIIYFTYASGTPEANRTELARGILRDDAVQDLQVLFRSNRLKSGGQHFGSRLLWLPDKTLLMTIGDGGNPPVSLEGKLIRIFAQDKTVTLGKVLRFNADGTAPSDNPFVALAGAAQFVFTYGHRNPQGLALDTRSGKIWETEHGAKGGDELNLLTSGGNYGWPEVTYSHEYSGPAVSELTTRSDVEAPRVVWTPSIAPSGLAFYTGDRYPQWKGDLFGGALVNQEVRRIHFEADKVVAETALSFGRRIRQVAQGPDGYLYVLTDHDDGELIRILPGSEIS